MKRFEIILAISYKIIVILLWISFWVWCITDAIINPRPPKPKPEPTPTATVQPAQTPEPTPEPTQEATAAPEPTPEPVIQASDFFSEFQQDFNSAKQKYDGQTIKLTGSLKFQPTAGLVKLSAGAEAEKNVAVYLSEMNKPDANQGDVVIIRGRCDVLVQTPMINDAEIIEIQKKSSGNEAHSGASGAKTIQEAQNELTAISDKLAKDTNGVVKSVKVNEAYAFTMTVSNVWYLSSQSDKQNFAETMYAEVNVLGKEWFGRNRSVFHIEDENGTTVAKQKASGGMEIKK